MRPNNRVNSDAQKRRSLSLTMLLGAGYACRYAFRLILSAKEKKMKKFYSKTVVFLITILLISCSQNDKPGNIAKEYIDNVIEIKKEQIKLKTEKIDQDEFMKALELGHSNLRKISASSLTQKTRDVVFRFIEFIPTDTIDNISISIGAVKTNNQVSEVELLINNRKCNFTLILEGAWKVSKASCNTPLYLGQD